MSAIRSLLLRLVRRFVPDRYEGRLDQLSEDDQRAVIASRFRSGM